VPPSCVRERPKPKNPVVEDEDEEEEEEEGEKEEEEEEEEKEEKEEERKARTETMTIDDKHWNHRRLFVCIFRVFCASPLLFSCCARVIWPSPQMKAVASISTRAPMGSALTAKQTRAGRVAWSGKARRYASLKAA